MNGESLLLPNANLDANNGCTFNCLPCNLLILEKLNIVVTVSGITFCGACKNVEGFSVNDLSSSMVNGAFSLTQSSLGSGFNVLTLPNALSFTKWSLPSCIGTSSSETADIQISFSCSGPGGGGWSLSIIAVDIGTIFTSTGDISIYDAVINTLSCSDSGVIAQSGSASLSW